MGWMILCYEATEGVSIDKKDIHFIGVPFLLLQYKNEIFLWLYEGSWDMVPNEYYCKFRILLFMKISFIILCVVLLTLIEKPSQEERGRTSGVSGQY
jgi:hypothetical protein